MTGAATASRAAPQTVPEPRSGPARSPAEAARVLQQVPRPGPDTTTVDLQGRALGGLTAVRASWGAGGGEVELTGRAPFVQLAGRAGFRSDGSLDGTVRLSADVAVVGVPVARAEWQVAGWDAAAPLPRPEASLRGSTVVLDTAAIGPEAQIRLAEGLTGQRTGAGWSIDLPTAALPPGTPLEPRVAELLGGLLGADLAALRVHRDARLEQAPAFVSNPDLFFAPGRYGADSPQTAALLHAAVTAALRGFIGEVAPSPPAPRPQPGPEPAPPAADTEPVPASAPPATEAPAAQAPTAEAPAAPAAEGPTAPSAAEAAAPATGTGGTPEQAAEVELLMPAAPSAPGPAATARMGGVAAGAGAAASTARDLPPAQRNVDDARGAVTEPAAETAARARERLAETLGERPAPSPEIVALTERIRTAIREQRPVDEDELLRSDPARAARDAGGTVTGSVQGQVETVQGSYDTMNSTPAGSPALNPTPVTPPDPAAPGMAAPATGAAPDPVPAQDLSLDADVAATDARIASSGIDTPVTREIPQPPFSEAREAREGLGEAAQQTPQQLAAAQQSAIDSAQTDMAALQEQATAALQQARSGTVAGVADRQAGMVTSEESTREAVSRRAQEIFDTAQTRVNTLLEPLSRTAMARWDAGLAQLTQQFRDALDRVQRWIDERHSGVGGFFVGLGDAVFGLPDWVIREYDRAERAFGDGVTTLLLDISRDVNGVVAAAQAIIAQARDDINAAFDAMAEQFPEWAQQERARFAGLLDGLSSRVTQAQTGFVRDVSRRAVEAVAEVQAAVEERRSAARGLVGRIVAAIEAFIDDPVRAIINGLLSLVGIPPASFWALVARIQQVIADIANDPQRFINNLMEGLRQGFQRFFDNFGRHLLAGFWNWLFSGLQTPIPMPTDFSLGSLMQFALQLMGITWARVREILARHIGERNVALIESAWQVVSTLIERGPAGLVELVRDRLSPDMLIGAILDAAIDFMVETIIQQVIVRVIGLFNPVGAIVQAIDAIYQVLAWVFRNAARIFSFVEAVVGGIANVIAGNVGGMAAVVERGLAMLIPPVIDFLAGLLHLGGLPGRVAEVIVRLQAMVYRALDVVVGFLAEQGRRLLARLGFGGGEEERQGGAEDTELGTTVRFAAAGESHRLWVAVTGNDATLMTASAPQTLADRIAQWRSRIDAGEPADDADRAEVRTTLGNLASVADAANTEGDRLAALFLAAQSDPDTQPPSDDALENRERAIAGMLQRVYTLMEERDPEEFVRGIAQWLPTRGEAYAGVVHGQWMPAIRRVMRAPAGGAAGERLWPDIVLANTEGPALALLGRDATHRLLLPWFLVGSTSQPRDPEHSPFTNYALQTDSPDPAHSVRPQFVTALGTAAADRLKQTGTQAVSNEENQALHTLLAAISFSMAGGRWGSFDPWPQDAVNPMIRSAVTAAGGIQRFLRAMVSPGSASGVTWDQALAVWNASPATKDWVKDRFRAVDPGAHEWIPTNFIPQVMEQALDAMERNRIDTALRWITAHTALRSRTNHVLFRPRVTVQPGAEPTVEIGGHVGSFREIDEPERVAGTVGTEEFHAWLRNEFTTNSGAGPVAYITHLQQELRTHVWDGDVADLPAEALDRPVGMLYRLDSGVDASLTLRQLADRQLLNWQQIMADFAAALSAVRG